MLTKILAETPWWVGLAFLFILLRGFLASRNRTVWLPSLFFMPCIMIAINAQSLLGATLNLQALYLCLFLIFGWFGFVLGYGEKITAIPDKNSLILKGTWRVMIVLLIFFASKFYFGFLKATNTLLAQEYQWILMSISVSLPGYLFGRSLGYAKQLHKKKK